MMRFARLTVLCVVLAVSLPASARALPASAPAPSSFVANGDVNAITRAGSTTYLGGNFTELEFRSRRGVA